MILGIRVPESTDTGGHFNDFHGTDIASGKNDIETAAGVELGHGGGEEISQIEVGGVLHTLFHNQIETGGITQIGKFSLVTH